MKFIIKHQERYSRGELILRTIFGWLYMALPHGFLLFFAGLWSLVLLFFAFWAVLFTGKYPKSFFQYQVGLCHWTTRLNARMYNLSDGYPPFGLKKTDDAIELEIPYPEKLSRGILILRVLFGWLYILIPHGFMLFFRWIATAVVIFIAWFIVLFTGRYPLSMHEFVTGTLRWGMRLNIYLCFMTDEYPPFTGK
ncbi:MAG: DUF4389 domain-containing protein [Bacteroidales bacterium]|nr:DUF4389 domain-containing protein [Bacteroidales bacterium]